MIVQIRWAFALCTLLLDLETFQILVQPAVPLVIAEKVSHRPGLAVFVDNGKRVLTDDKEEDEDLDEPEDVSRYPAQDSDEDFDALGEPLRPVRRRMASRPKANAKRITKVGLLTKTGCIITLSLTTLTFVVNRATSQQAFSLGI